MQLKINIYYSSHLFQNVKFLTKDFLCEIIRMLKWIYITIIPSTIHEVKFNGQKYYIYRQGNKGQT